MRYITLAILLLSSCGEDGAPGPQGETGPAGNDGMAGLPGGYELHDASRKLGMLLGPGIGDDDGAGLSFVDDGGRIWYLSGTRYSYIPLLFGSGDCSGAGYVTSDVLVGSVASDGVNLWVVESGGFEMDFSINSVSSDSGCVSTALIGDVVSATMVPDPLPEDPTPPLSIVAVSR